ncbi:MAG: c-type cytochrome [Deltaproteobacteria bacterium]|nr:c-type cytochrome [Deltaproteobacteria bacterium]
MRKLFIVGVIGTILGFTNPCIAADGNAIYNKKCSGCHGVDGKGIIIGLKLHQKLM